MSSFVGCFSVAKPIIAMLHLPPLPGALQYTGEAMNTIIDETVASARVLVEGGINGLLVENTHDEPFQREGTEPHTISAISLIVNAITSQVKVPVGLHILRNAPFAGLAVTHVTGGSFIRYNFMTDAYVTDQGIIQGSAHAVHQYRRLLGSKTLLLCDVHPKYAAPLGIRPLEEAASDLAFRGHADAIIVSGSQTGKAPTREEVTRVKDAVGDTPVIIGSGLVKENMVSLLKVADGAIVGSTLKQGGVYTNPVDPDRVRVFMEAVDEFRSSLP